MYGEVLLHPVTVELPPGSPQPARCAPQPGAGREDARARRAALLLRNIRFELSLSTPGGVGGGYWQLLLTQRPCAFTSLQGRWGAGEGPQLGSLLQRHGCPDR